MAKLPAPPAWLKKYYFWMLLGIEILAVLGLWFMVTSDLADQYGSREQAIKGRFNEMRTISGQPSPPNEQVIKAIEEKHKQLKDKALQAWEKLYKDQDTKNPWPEVLGPKFLEMIQNLKPGQEIPDEYREHYQNVIEKYFPTLFELVNRRHPVRRAGAAKAAAAAAAAAGAAPDAAAAKVPMEGVVRWDDSSVDQIKNKFKWGKTPSTLEIRLAQEDLWVYRALLEIIENTNQGFTSYYNAPVKQIDALEIGADASKAWLAAENAVGKPAESGGNAPAGGSGGGTESAQTNSEAKRLQADRYVNEKGKPLGPDDIPPFAEFKMMPIHMRLVMDQSKINKLLAECANRNMPVEVRRVRLTAATGPVAAATSESSGGASPSGGDSDNTAHAETSATSDVQVEIQGIIYIYNPPDRAKLGTGAVGERLGIDQTHGAAGEPAGTTPPANPSPAAPGAPAPAGGPGVPASGGGTSRRG
jgi:hypothetical protein